MGDRGDHPGEGHRSRLRERFLTAGLAGFHDHEVIELLLTLATPRKDCKAAAKAALERFGSLQAVFEATAGELADVPGIGARNLFGIKLIKAVSDRYLEKKIMEKPAVHNAAELFDFLRHRLRDRPRECFTALFLDAKNRVLAVRILFEGTLTAASVYPREVVREALDQRAAALIFAHNHPSGDPSPSPEDTALTRQLVMATALMGITVHEHIIIGEAGYYSYAEHGLIARMREESQGRLS
ncbi:MAG: RadC family protein [Desulfobacterales bacterium]